MAVFRIEKTKDYTVMANCHLRDRNLTLKAKGLQSLMLSLPESWDFTMKGLATICKDGISSVRSGLLELENAGYLKRNRIRNESGQFDDIEYVILEQPVAPEQEIPQPKIVDKSQNTVDNHVDNSQINVDNSQPTYEKPTSQNPICENPTLVKPISEKRTQLSTKANQELKELNTHELNNHQSIPSKPEKEMDAIEIYKQILKENIEYENLCIDHKFSKDIITEILELMLETVCSKRKTIRVGGEDKPAELVKSRMLKLDQFHIEYALETLDKNTTEVRNIKSYLLTTLYNAPTTIGNYYKAMVNHDMYGGGLD